MNVEDYRSLLHEEVAYEAEANISNVTDAFINYVIDILIEGEEFEDYVECFYESTNSRGAAMQVDGYAFDESDGTCSVIISDYRGPYEKDDSVRGKEITAAFDKIRRFVDDASKHPIYKELEESTQIYEFASKLYFELDSIRKFRFYFITDAYNKQRTKKLEKAKAGGRDAELNVWDIERIFSLVNSSTLKESVEIILQDMGFKGIPCVKAVDYSDIVADIEVNLSEQNDTDKRQNVISYKSYLAVVPGEVLNDLYLEYGSRLLEGNVRSFLSSKVAVNKNIQSTIKNYPEMFFAYNNGIAATATELDTVMTNDGLMIQRIKDLQIVNGGQTTASIANTLLKAKKDENVDISKLYVPMKISVLEHSMSEKIIPKISEYSNSQNKVDASDFFSNHPFHIRMEEYSRKIPAPAVDGNQFQQYWFYERTRGQYNQGKMKFKPKSSELKKYETKYPASQVIKMVDFAKYMMIYDCAPDIVSKGKQNMIKAFSAQIKQSWTKDNDSYNDFYFKRAVALAIIFKRTDDIVKNTSWYKVKRSYKANVVAYTMSIIFNHVKYSCKGQDVDFMKIWNTQKTYKELDDQLAVLCTEVYEFITRDDRMTENVTEWCKKSACWERAKAHKWTFLPEFCNYLTDKKDIKETIKNSKDVRKLANTVEEMKFILGAGSEYWRSVLEWGKQYRRLTDLEITSIKKLIDMEYTGKVPTDRQLKVIKLARDHLIKDGMPYIFK